jgi:hypothetical protein
VSRQPGHRADLIRTDLRRTGAAAGAAGLNDTECERCSSRIATVAVRKTMIDG